MSIASNVLEAERVLSISPSHSKLRSGWYLLHSQCYEPGSDSVGRQSSFELPHNNRRPCNQLPNQSSYIEDGYSITRTDAPKDLGGRFRLNCARTTPERPGDHIRRILKGAAEFERTVWSGDLAPDDPDF